MDRGRRNGCLRMAEPGPGSAPTFARLRGRETLPKGLPAGVVPSTASSPGMRAPPSTLSGPRVVAGEDAAPPPEGTKLASAQAGVEAAAAANC